MKFNVWCFICPLQESDSLNSIKLEPEEFEPANPGVEQPSSSNTVPQDAPLLPGHFLEAAAVSGLLYCVLLS